MVPPITAAFVVSSALLACPRCALGPPYPAQCRVRGRGRNNYRVKVATAASSFDGEQIGEHGEADDAQPAHEEKTEKLEPATTSNDDAKKPQSRLAMAAADWLEEEDEDELAMYWDRFDAAKAASKRDGGEQGAGGKAGITDKSTLTTTNDNTIANASTEELLERYHQSRGINKEEELKYGPQIEEATRAAKGASSASEAIRILEAVRPYLQYNTKLGGNAYLELARALDSDDEMDAATDIYRELAASPHADIRRQAREMLARGDGANRPKRQYKRGIWDMLWDGWGD